jgi:hypothetical protein
MVLKGGLKIMKTIFKKAITVLSSFVMVGATIGAAAAASYPAPFNAGNAAVVYSSSASVAQSDINAANAIVNSLSKGTGSGLH